MTPHEYTQWNTVRAQGLWLYALKRYVPTYGLLFAALTLGLHLWSGQAIHWPMEAAEFAFKALIFGFIMAWLQWRQNEKSYALGAPTPDNESPAECLECAASIPAGEMRCPACGWSYEGDGKPDP